MKPSISEHPTLADLRAFGQGRLAEARCAAVEDHVAACDRCCQMLDGLQDDPLLALVREAAELDHCEGITRSFNEDARTTPLVDFVPPGGIPDALQDHPRYRVIERVGAGGMGVVYKAEHRFMDRVVALKVINPGLMSNRSAVARFQKEVRAAAKLNHPSIVAAFDADQAGELHFLVMEYIDGVSLARLVEKKGPLPLGQASHFVRQAALALQHAHLQGLVHRDIKPQNLMVTRKGQVKLLDLGLARIVDAADSDSESSQSGGSLPHLPTDSFLAGAMGQRTTSVARGTATSMVLGTPDYLAPEQAENSKTVDIRADLYSLGCTLYFLLTGRVPFPEGSIFERLVQHKLDEPTPVEQLRPDLPSEVADIVRKLMAKAPEDRFQSPAELAAALAPHASLQSNSFVVEREEAPKERAANTLTLSDGDTHPVSQSEVRPKAKIRRIVRRERRPRQNNSTVYRWIAAAVAFQVLLFGGAGIRSYLRRQSDEQTIAAPHRLAALPPASNANRTAQQNEPPKSPTAPTAQAGIPPTANAPSPAEAESTDAKTAAPSSQRDLPSWVLFVLPQRQLWNEDYLPVRRRLEAAGIVVKTASSRRGPCQPDPGSTMQETADPDFVLGDDVDASAFDAIVFVGFNVFEFVQKGAHAGIVKNLVGDLNRKGKIVSAICVGQAVLAYHGLLNGRRVARNPQMAGKMNYDSLNTVDRPVVVDGNIITGRHPNDANAFADTLISELKKRR